MPYSLQSNAQTVPELTGNAIEVLWYGPLQVGTFLYPTTRGSAWEEGAESDVHSSTESWTSVNPWVNVDGGIYHDKRTGWIKLRDNLGAIVLARVDQWSEICFGTTVLEVLELVNVVADYRFFNSVTFPRENSAQTTIESTAFGESNANSIPIGGDGTTVSASYMVGLSDAGQLGGEAMFLTIEIRENDALGNQIYFDTVSQSGQGELSLSKVLTAAEIGSATRIWVRVDISLAGIL